MKGRAWLAAWLAAALLAGIVARPAPAPAADSAVVFVYHRFGEDEHSATNIRIDQFQAHVDELTTGGYTVLPLPDVVAALRRREPLPERTVALTVDDAYRSVREVAWPVLRRAGLPLTVFVSTDSIENSADSQMSWDQLRELSAAGVTIGHHGAAHLHMPEHSPERLQEDLQRASRHLREELGYVPRLFAYPYGEFGAREQQIVREAGFDAAFGQHSGVMHADSDLFALPRFALNEQFGSMDRFRLAANALPLPVRDLAPADFVLRRNNPPPLGFTVADPVGALDQLNCYASNQNGPARIERLGPRRIEVRLETAFAPGRGRINCTLPAGDGRWRWFGVPFYVPLPN